MSKPVPRTKLTDARIKSDIESMYDLAYGKSEEGRDLRRTLNTEEAYAVLDAAHILWRAASVELIENIFQHGIKSREVKRRNAEKRRSNEHRN